MKTREFMIGDTVVNAIATFKSPFILDRYSKEVFAVAVLDNELLNIISNTKSNNSILDKISKIESYDKFKVIILNISDIMHDKDDYNKWIELIKKHLYGN